MEPFQQLQKDLAKCFREIPRGVRVTAAILVVLSVVGLTFWGGD